MVIASINLTDPMAELQFNKNMVKYLEYAKHNCRKCHGRGKQDCDIPKKVAYTKLCDCVLRNLERAGVKIENG